MLPSGLTLHRQEPLPLSKKILILALLSWKTLKKCLLFDAVISSQSEPFPGWVDNFNGPLALLAAGSKGFLRISFGDPDIIQDLVPVDFCIQLLLIAAWYQAVSG
jgi:hypothetical protein